MRKNDVDNIVYSLIKEGWRGKTYKDFKEKLGNSYSYDQIGRVRARYLYITKKSEDNGNINQI